MAQGEEGTSDAEPRREDVARRAYEKYEQRGAEHGHDQDDWFEAERELRESTTGNPPAREEA
jgi:hypothetical protein